MKKTLYLTRECQKNDALRKIWMTMKLSVILFFVSLTQLMATEAYAQFTKLTLQLKDVTVREVLNQIEDESQFFFLYNRKLVDVDRKVSVEFKDQKISEILNSIFEGADVAYTVVDRQIVLTNKADQNSFTEVINQQQQKAITGTVTDNNGPLPGVNIVVTGTTQGTLTDVAGKYSIEVPQGAKSLTFSFIGMEPQEITIGTQTQIDITMAESAIGLEEVVVIGYGTMKRGSLTSAIASVKNEDLIKSVSVSPAQGIAGKIAGVLVSQEAAVPGSATILRIRGSENPLYVIDGMPISGGKQISATGGSVSPNTDPYSFINPDDIESIEILKDAAATAIYGSQGSGGVVMITTKKGQAGKENINVSVKTGVQILGDFERLSGREWAEEIYKVQKLDNFSNPYFATFEETQVYGKGTDWLDLVTRKGTFTNANASLSGGSQKTQYYISGEYYGLEGVVKESGLDKFTGRINLTNKGKRHRITLTTNYSLQTRQSVPTNNNSSAEWASVITAALGFPPVLEPKDEDGNYTINHWQTITPNPVAMLEIEDIEKRDRIVANLNFQYDIFKGFFINADLGYDREGVNRETYIPKTTVLGKYENGIARLGVGTIENVNTFVSLNYVREFGNHGLNTVVGVQRQLIQDKTITMDSKNFPTDALLFNAFQTGDLSTHRINNSHLFNGWLSYLGRANYSFKNKYLATVTFRYDGSSKFQQGNKFLFYPSVSAAWRISEEDFFNVAPISDLKLRASWGQTGRDATALSDAYELVRTTQLIFNNKQEVTMGQNNIINPDLTWELVTEQNVGLDFAFFKGRLTGFVDMYSKTRENMLASRSLPPDRGFTSIRVNKGVQKNTGWELSLTGTAINTSNWNWNLSGNVFRNWWRWVKRIDNTPLLYRKIDDDISAIYGYVITGMINTEADIPAHMPGAVIGDWIRKDVNGRDSDGNFKNEPDGVLTTWDMVYLGTSQPGWSWGASSVLTYKKAFLNVNVQAMMDRALNNSVRSSAGSILAEYKDRWTPDNLYTGKILRSGGKTSPYNSFSPTTYFIEDASFVRVKNIMLGYNIDTQSRLPGIRGLSVYFDIQNPFLFTKFSLVDPETAAYTADPYPNSKTYIIGFDIKF